MIGLEGLRVIDVYVPNGQSLGSEAFFYKLDWLGRLQAHLVAEHTPKEPLVLTGDFNITPDDRDVWDAEVWKGSIHCSPHERRALTYLEAWGLRDAQRLTSEMGGIFTWFDYRDSVKGLDTSRGLRIDLALTSPAATAITTGVHIDRAARAFDRPSDHAPVIVELTP